MKTHGDSVEEVRPDTVDPGLAAATLSVYAHRHEVVHLLYSATDEPDALRRVAEILHLEESTVARVLDQPLRWMTAPAREALELAAARGMSMIPEPGELATTAAGPDQV
jgi:hypothetical protein